MSLLAMHLGIIRAAEAAWFFGAEPDDPDRPQGLSSIPNVHRRGGDDGHARGIVNRARAFIPAVEVAADQENWCLWIASGDFSDDIARWRALGLLTDEGQAHSHGPAALEDADELLGVRDC